VQPLRFQAARRCKLTPIYEDANFFNRYARGSCTTVTVIRPAPTGVFNSTSIGPILSTVIVNGTVSSSYAYPTTFGNITSSYAYPTGTVIASSYAYPTLVDGTASGSAFPSIIENGTATTTYRPSPTTVVANFTISSIASGAVTAYPSSWDSGAVTVYPSSWASGTAIHNTTFAPGATSILTLIPGGTSTAAATPACTVTVTIDAPETSGTLGALNAQNNQNGASAVGNGLMGTIVAGVLAGVGLVAF
jgi:hypothetical protein